MSGHAASRTPNTCRAPPQPPGPHSQKELTREGSWNVVFSSARMILTQRLFGKPHQGRNVCSRRGHILSPSPVGAEYFGHFAPTGLVCYLQHRATNIPL